VTPIGRVPDVGTVPDSHLTGKLARLAKAAKQFEAVFVQQMFAAMRETVPKDGIASGGEGEELFSSMLDQQLANRAPEHWRHDLSDVIVAQLRSRVVPPGTVEGRALPTPTPPNTRENH
jgi:flagellar protein FlgJ